MKNDTIAAIATARGQSGVSIIKISGSDSIEIADKIFKSANGSKIKDIEGYQALYGKIYDKDEYLDEVIVLKFTSPHSYTGEDVVEIQCHGGIYISEMILKLVLDSGASLASPGEFTQRAYLNGKLDLTEAESVMDIISAQGKKAAKAALAAKDGALSKKIEKVKKELLNIASHLSAYSDYPDEDIPGLGSENLKDRLEEISNDLEALLGTYEAGKIIKEGVDTVIIGKPNVGKSTLMNYLVGQEKSIVTDLPGTTRDIVEETISLGDFILKISDTAGIRDTNDVIEQIGVKRAKDKINTADLIFAVFDLSRDLSTEDLELVENVDPSKTIAILNKSDLDIKFDYKKLAKKLKRQVFISAETGSGVKDLAAAIADIIKVEQIDLDDGFLFNRRQFECAKKALNSVKEALDAVQQEMTLDAIEVLIEEAIEELLLLTGERVSEVVTNEVFSRFCVGK
ncbi:MAG: tRNA uridine-5-carboxymethylaminomethyl(34) synthesis GTPase MnmE [Clostridia bacterium]|nr:tRNA uridine-5-carboxymethylaminomethyl(34) synthesis GTPase MnmE [Clostridia bacterium]